VAHLKNGLLPAAGVDGEKNVTCFRRGGVGAEANAASWRSATHVCAGHLIDFGAFGGRVNIDVAIAARRCHELAVGRVAHTEHLVS